MKNDYVDMSNSGKARSVSVMVKSQSEKELSTPPPQALSLTRGQHLLSIDSQLVSACEGSILGRECVCRGCMEGRLTAIHAKHILYICIHILCIPALHQLTHVLIAMRCVQ